MIYEGTLEGKDIYLRAIALDDCAGGYLTWLLDDEVSRYLESRLATQTLESTQRFVLDVRESPTEYMFAIVRREDGSHIGNIKVGPIHPVYKTAFVGYLIGDRGCWGRGYATDAIRLATRFCFEELGLNKVSAGVIAPNVGSIRALEKAGYKQEGCFRQDTFVDGAFHDVYRYAILKEEYDALGGMNKEQ